MLVVVVVLLLLLMTEDHDRRAPRTDGGTIVPGDRCFRKLGARSHNVISLSDDDYGAIFCW
jgi:hypothetical protein